MYSLQISIRPSLLIILLRSILLHSSAIVIRRLDPKLLTVHLAELLRYEPEREDILHKDVLAAARLLLDRDCEEEARGYLASLLSSENREVAMEAGRILSLSCKRKGDWTEAVGIWEKMVTEDACHIFAVEELAKWCEHRKGDLDRALNLVNNVLENAPYLSTAERDAFVYRFNRLKRRIEKRE